MVFVRWVLSGQLTPQSEGLTFDREENIPVLTYDVYISNGTLKSLGTVPVV